MLQQFDRNIKKMYTLQETFKFKILRPWIVLTEGDTINHCQVMKRCERMSKNSQFGSNLVESEASTHNSRTKDDVINIKPKPQYLKNICSLESIGNVNIQTYMQDLKRKNSKKNYNSKNSKKSNDVSDRN